MDKSSEASAFIAVLLTFFGLSDLTAASLDDLPALEYWLNNVPVRLTVLFAVTAYSYLFKEGGYLGPTLGAGRHLCNSWVFTFAFMELMVWYWVSDLGSMEYEDTRTLTGSITDLHFAEGREKGCRRQDHGRSEGRRGGVHIVRHFCTYAKLEQKSGSAFYFKNVFRSMHICGDGESPSLGHMEAPRDRFGLGFPSKGTLACNRTNRADNVHKVCVTA
jgi:hypothetical protein